MAKKGLARVEKAPEPPPRAEKAPEPPPRAEKAPETPARAGSVRTGGLATLALASTLLAVAAAVAAALYVRAGAQAARSSPGVELSLKAVLDSEMSGLAAKVLSRAKTEGCRQRVHTMTNHTLLRFERSFERHATAELACPVHDIINHDKDASVNGWPRRQPKASLAKCDATIAFSIELVPRAKRPLLARLLDRIVRPSHVYVFTIDSTPNPGGKAVRGLEAYVRARMAGAKGAHLVGVLTGNDVVYQGQSLLRAQLVALRALLEDGVPSWDFVINLSGSDYPVRSVEFTARQLAASGARSYLESWLQVPDHGNGRDLWAWFIECPEEPCKGNLPREKCQGYVFQHGWRRKPPLGPVREFGGSAWWVLHHDFVRYTWSCLESLPPDEEERYPAVHQLLSAVTASNRLAEPVAETDVAYCRSVRGMYQWFSTSYDPAETFLHTVLFNGPHCAQVGLGSLHWVAWDPRAGDQSCNTATASGDYPNKRPGCLAMEGAGGHPMLPTSAWSVEDGVGRACAETAGKAPARKPKACADEYHPALARKFSLDEPRFARALDVADDAAASWDQELARGLFRCAS